MYVYSIYQYTVINSRITGSESQGQEETACAHPANVTIGVIYSYQRREISKHYNLVTLGTTA